RQRQTAGGGHRLFFFLHERQEFFRLLIRQRMLAAGVLLLELAQLRPLADGLLVILVLRVGGFPQKSSYPFVEILLFGGQLFEHLRAIGRGSASHQRGRFLSHFHSVV